MKRIKIWIACGVFLSFGVTQLTSSGSVFTNNELRLESGTTTLLQILNGQLGLKNSKSSSGTVISPSVSVNGIAATMSATFSDTHYLPTALASKTYIDSGLSFIHSRAESDADFDINDYVDSDELIGMIISVASGNYSSEIESSGRWLYCNGQIVPTENYPTLSARIGTTFGGTLSGFQVPNIEDRVIVGAGPAGAGTSTRDVASTGGSNTIALTISNLPPHTHGITDPGHTHLASVYKNGFAPQNDELVFIDGASPVVGTATTVTDRILNAVTNITLSTTGSGASFNQSQPYLVVRHYIRAK